MHTRTRTALVTLTLNTVLTVLKFVAFAFTGSLAILAEAWHSFADIATSATALLAVRRQLRQQAGDRRGHSGDPFAHFDKKRLPAGDDPSDASMTLESLCDEDLVAETTETDASDLSITMESSDPAAITTEHGPVTTGEWSSSAHQVPDWPEGSGDGEEDEASEPGNSSPGSLSDEDAGAANASPSDEVRSSRWRWLANAFSPVGRFLRWIWRLQPEQQAALVIGLFLAGIGIAVLRKVLTASPTEVDRPLAAGIAFLVFSLASYGVSRFELGVGKSEGSAALSADGMHARADAVATLLTGISLIIYHFGFNVDRPVAGFLGLIILSFAAETLVNLVMAARRGDGKFVLEHRTTDLLAALVDPRTMVRYGRQLLGWLDRGGATARGVGRALRAVPWLVLVAIVLGYGSTALYRVQPHEEGIVEVFGQVANPREPAQPGLHVKLPWPMARVYKIPSQRVQELEVGNVTRDPNVPLIWTRQHGTDEVFVSGDNNFLYPYLVVHYRVADAYDYHYGVMEPQRVITNVAVGVLTRESAQLDFYEAALERRDELGAHVAAHIQQELDGMNAGVEIIDVLVKDIHPPRDVARSFEGVVAAMQDHQTLINAAEGYRNAKIPQSRADALRRVAEAHAYVADNKIRSEGDSARFTLRREAFKTNRRVTRQRLYVDAMVRALKGRRKVIVSPDAGQPDLWLDQSVPAPPRPTRKRSEGSSGGSGR